MIGKFIDLTGQKFNKLTPIKYLGKSKWLCKCDCGNVTEVQRGHLQNGHTKSCGCLTHKPNKNNLKHGLCNTRLYNIYRGMKQRCYYDKHSHYKDYGGRGITICKEWLHDFQAFYDWSVTHGYDDNLTIDRVDNNKGYSPDNCRFVSNFEQQNNRRDNVYLTYDNKTLSIRDWAKELNVNVKTLYTRKFKNWNVKDVLFGRGNI